MNPAMEELRHATQDLHQALEATAAAQDLLSSSLVRERYAHILRLWASSWAALEDSIHRSPWAQSMRHLLVTPRAVHALHDLRYLGFDADDVFPAGVASGQVQIAVPASQAALLGRCYVMRGAALGGRVIAKHLSRSLGFGQNQGSSFFSAGDAEVLSWPQWGKQLDLSLASSEDRQQAVQEARATFQFLLQTFTSAGVSGARGVA